MSIALFLDIMLLLWTVNLLPPLLAYNLEERWDRPVDLGRLFLDGRPLFGPHKTYRGIVGAVLGGGAAAVLLGLGAPLGFAAGALSMAGDLISSFIKRRMGRESGSDVPGLDQVFEGALPLTLIMATQDIPAYWSVPCLMVFCLGAWLGSKLYKGILFREPFSGYPRRLRPKVRLKEIVSCRLDAGPLRLLLNFEDAVYYHLFIKGVFQVLGLYGQGMANALAVQPKRLTLALEGLPEEFRGYRIAFMSDLHLDGMDGLVERLVDIIRAEEVDLCLLGGDYRMATHGPHEEAASRVALLARYVRAKDGIMAVLGNHDCLEMIEPFKAAGIEVLLNDARLIERNGGKIAVTGVDDPHFYQCHSLQAACGDLGRERFLILVAHSPELYREAADMGVSLYLCGHTHAGQVQLPHIGPVFTHSRSPRAICQGLWRHGRMTGYTSAGVGVSGVAVRFNTVGEVVFLTLVPA